MLVVLRHVFAFVLACWVGNFLAFMSLGGTAFFEEGWRSGLREIAGIFLFSGMLVMVAAPIVAPFAIASLVALHRLTGGRWPLHALAGAVTAPLASGLWIAIDDGWGAFASGAWMGLTFIPAAAAAALSYRALVGGHRSPFV